MNTEDVMLQQEDAMTDLRLATFFVMIVFAWTCLECCCVFAVFSGFCDQDNFGRSMSVDCDCDCDCGSKCECTEWNEFLNAYQKYN